jgi:hypothetical protein
MPKLFDGRKACRSASGRDNTIRITLELPSVWR